MLITALPIFLFGLLRPAYAWTEADEPVWVQTIGGLSADGELNIPRGIAIDGADIVYVVESRNHRVTKFDSNGNFLSKFGEYGALDGQFISPLAIAVDSFGNLYITDGGNDRLQKFEPVSIDGCSSPGEFEVGSSGYCYVAKWGSLGTGDTQFNNPYAISQNNGYLYIADTGNNRIVKYDVNGNFVTKWGLSGTTNGKFRSPWGVFADSHGNVFVGDDSNHRVQKFEPVSVDGCSSPGEFEVDSSGYCYVTKWGSYGSGNGYFNASDGVWVDSSDYVYVSDVNNQRIQKFAPKPNPGDLCTDYGWTEPTPLVGSGYCFVTKWEARGLAMVNCYGQSR